MGLRILPTTMDQTENTQHNKKEEIKIYEAHHCKEQKLSVNNLTHLNY